MGPSVAAWMIGLMALAVALAVEPLPFLNKEQLLAPGVMHIHGSTMDEETGFLYFATSQTVGQFTPATGAVKIVAGDFGSTGATVHLIKWNGAKFLAITSGASVWLANPPLDASGLSPSANITNPVFFNQLRFDDDVVAPFVTTRLFVNEDSTPELWTFYTGVPTSANSYASVSRRAPRSFDRIYETWTDKGGFQIPNKLTWGSFAINQPSRQVLLAQVRGIVDTTSQVFAFEYTAEDLAAGAQLTITQSTSVPLPFTYDISASPYSTDSYVAMGVLASRLEYHPNASSPYSYVPFASLTGSAQIRGLSLDLIGQSVVTLAATNADHNNYRLGRAAFNAGFLSQNSESLAVFTNTDFLSTSVSALRNEIYLFGQKGDSNNTYVQYYGLSACSNYTTCSECIARDKAYCGWCVGSDGSSSCASKFNCTAPKLRLDSCPVISSLNPASGSIVGGNTITLVGTGFSASPLTCKFGSQPATNATFLSDGIMTCPSPTSGSTGSVSVTLNYGTAVVSPSKTFNYYDCGSFVNCTSCGSEANPECGWCVSDGVCVSRFANPRCATSFSLFVTAGASTRCAQLLSMTPESDLDIPEGGSTVTITADYFLNATQPGDWKCLFGSTQVTGTVNVEAKTLTCPTPNAPSSPYNGSVFVSILYKGISYGSNALPFSYYNCPQATSCGACLAPLRSKCRWCLSSRTCGVVGDACTDASSVCPSVSFNPLSAFESTAENIVVSGGPFTSQGSTQYTCDFGAAGNTQATYVSDSQLTCQSPSRTVTGSSEEYSFTLLHQGTDYVPSNSSFRFYSCRGTSCTTCVHPTLQPNCRWCFDGQACSAVSEGLPCATQVSSQCPRLISVSPSNVVESGNVSLTVMGSQFFASQSYDCVFTPQPSGTATNAPAVILDATTLQCTVPDFTGFPGGYDLEVQSASQLLDAKLDLDVSRCSLQASCDACTGVALCGWCPLLRTCTNTTCTSGPKYSQCPVIYSIEPNYGETWNRRTISVAGKLLSKDPFGTTVDALVCAFGSGLESSTLATPFTGTNGSVDYLECPTPFKSAPGTVPFSVYLINKVGTTTSYTSGPDFDYFDCRGATDCATCTSSASSQYCGWCLTTDSCTAQASCPVNNWIKDSCPTLLTASRDYSDAAVSTTITVTGQRFQENLPLTCMFGSIPSPNVGIINSTAMVCDSPIRTSASPGSFSAPITIRKVNSTKNYADNVIPFEFVDCSKNAQSVGTCAGCLPPLDSRCGWCLYDSICTAGALGCTTQNAFNTFLTGTDICPGITSITPNSASPTGGTLITIIGHDFVPNPNLKCAFGESLLVAATFVSPTEIHCTTPITNATQDISVQFGLMIGSTEFSANRLAFLFETPIGPNSVVTPGTPIFLPENTPPWVYAIIAVVIVVVIAGSVVAGVFLWRRRKLQNPTLVKPDLAPIAFANNTRLMYPVPDSKHAGYTKLAEALKKNDFALARLLGKVSNASDDDLLTKSFVYVASRNGFALDLILDFIKHEVANSELEGELFRSNSLACKMFTVYSKVIGLDYLWSTLAAAINTLDKAGQEEELKAKGELKGHLLQDVGTLEVDPERLAEKLEKEVDEAIQEDVNISNVQLLLYCGRIYKRVLDSLPKVRTEFKLISHTVKSLVAPKFSANNADYKGVGAFFFLRFICPAVMTPQIYGLLPGAPCETSQRYFVLISKTLQNLANETLPGAKEDYMVKMNEFVTDNLNSYHKFTDSMADKTILDKVPTGPLVELDGETSPRADSPRGAAAAGIPVPDDIYWSSLAFLHEYMEDKWDKIQEEDSGIAKSLSKIKGELGDPVKQPKAAKPKAKKRGNKSN